MAHFSISRPNLNTSPLEVDSSHRILFAYPHLVPRPHNCGVTNRENTSGLTQSLSQSDGKEYPTSQSTNGARYEADPAGTIFGQSNGNTVRIIRLPHPCSFATPVDMLMQLPKGKQSTIAGDTPTVSSVVNKPEKPSGSLSDTSSTNTRSDDTLLQGEGQTKATTTTTPTTAAETSYREQTAVRDSSCGVYLYELQRCARQIGDCSAFVDDAVLSDGSVYTATPLDPMFLVLHLLIPTLPPQNESEDGFSSDKEETRNESDRENTEEVQSQPTAMATVAKKVTGRRSTEPSGGTWQRASDLATTVRWPEGGQINSNMVMVVNAVKHRLHLIADVLQLSSSTGGEEEPLCRLNLDKVAHGFVKTKLDRMVSAAVEKRLYIAEYTRLNSRSPVEHTAQNEASNAGIKWNRQYQIDQNRLRTFCWDMIRGYLPPKIVAPVRAALRIADWENSDEKITPAKRPLEVCRSKKAEIQETGVNADSTGVKSEEIQSTSLIHHPERETPLGDARVMKQQKTVVKKRPMDLKGVKALTSFFPKK